MQATSTSPAYAPLTRVPAVAPNLKRIPALDGIRGLAILWVIVHNASDQLPSTLSGPLRPYAMLVHPGWIGVQLFFALSGFLITSGLLETRESSRYYPDFYTKRALRILPLYYSVLLGLLIVTPFAYPHDELRRVLLNQAQLWAFISNWTHMNLTGFTHFWSLAIEEQFYLLWPLVVRRFSPRPLLRLCVGIAIAALVIRCVMVAAGASADALYYYTVCRMDALALGAAGAALVRVQDWSQAARDNGAAVAVAVLATLAAAALMTRGFDTKSVACQTFGYSVLAIGCAVLVTGGALAARESTMPLMTLLRWPPLRSCGKYSYAMYVFHFPIHKLLGGPALNLLAPHGASGLLALLYAITLALVSYVLGAFSYFALESRLLRLKPPSLITQ